MDIASVNGQLRSAVAGGRHMDLTLALYCHCWQPTKREIQFGPWTPNTGLSPHHHCPRHATRLFLNINWFTFWHGIIFYALVQRSRRPRLRLCAARQRVVFQELHINGVSIEGDFRANRALMHDPPPSPPKHTLWPRLAPTDAAGVRYWTRFFSLPHRTVVKTIKGSLKMKFTANWEIRNINELFKIGLFISWWWNVKSRSSESLLFNTWVL